MKQQKTLSQLITLFVVFLGLCGILVITFIVRISSQSAAEKAEDTAVIAVETVTAITTADITAQTALKFDADEFWYRQMKRTQSISTEAITTSIDTTTTVTSPPETTARVTTAVTTNTPQETTVAPVTTEPVTTIQDSEISDPLPATTTNNKQFIGYMKVTGYTAEEGFYAGKLTASGHPCEDGICAMNNTRRKELGIKYGDQIYIEGLGTYTVYDCGCSYNTIDIWLRTNREAYAITGHYNIYRVIY